MNEDELNEIEKQILRQIEEMKNKGGKPTNQPSPSLPTFVDFSRYRNEGLQTWKSFINPDLNFAQNLIEIIKAFVILPQAELQLPILASMLLAPTPCCNILPICFCIGAAGSGKSTIGKIAGELYGIQILNASSTFAAIRNECNSAKWHDSEECEGEKAYLLIWDDLKAGNLINNPNVYDLLRGGYDRKTDKIAIATEGGKNLVFRVFGGRLISSIDPFFNHPKLSELQRRVLPIVCKKLDSDELLESKVDFDDFDWGDFNSQFNAFWTETRYIALSNARNALSRSKSLKKKLGKYLTISKDLIATSVACNLFASVEDAVWVFSQYWEEVAKPMFEEVAPTVAVLKNYIDSKFSSLEEIAKITGIAMPTPEIDPKEIANRLLEAQKNGELGEYATPTARLEAMAVLGWKLGEGSDGQQKWVRSQG